MGGVGDVLTERLVQIFCANIALGIALEVGEVAVLDVNAVLPRRTKLLHLLS